MKKSKRIKNKKIKGKNVSLYDDKCNQHEKLAATVVTSLTLTEIETIVTEEFSHPYRFERDYFQHQQKIRLYYLKNSLKLPKNSLHTK